MITISLKNISHRSINSLCYIFIYYTFWIFNHRKPHLEPSNGQTHQIKQTQPINTVENVFYVFTFPQCTHFYYFVTKVSKVPFPFEIIKCKLNYRFAVLQRNVCRSRPAKWNSSKKKSAIPFYQLDFLLKIKLIQ